MAHCHTKNKLYHPIPFQGYEGAGSVRGDCKARWDEIRKHLPDDFFGMSFLDYGCAEGYFLWMALKEGAQRAVFIDHDESCLRFAMELAGAYGYSKKCEFSDRLPGDSVDVAFYLDVHYNGKTPSILDFSKKCRLLFVSPSGHGDTNSMRLEAELREVFQDVEPIFKGYENRTMFKCCNLKEKA